MCAKKQILKYLVVLALFGISTRAVSGTYYVSAAGSDSNNGLSTGAPFRTMAKLQTVLVSGTIANIRAGDIFIGPLSVPASCIVQRYGTGANPIITGFDDLTTWTSIGTNKWQSNDPALLASLKVVTIGGTQEAVARFPRTSYATYTTVGGMTSITSASLAGTYTGQVQVVIKKNHFDMQTYPVVSVSTGGLIAYGGGGGNSPTPGYGAFLQNANEFLTAPGDWVYDGSGNVTVYNIGSPSNVKASRLANVITVSGNSATINGIDVQGANQYGIYTNNRSGTLIENCNITLCDIGIYQNNASSSVITNCTFDRTNGNAITLATSLNNTITNCTVTNAGMIQGAASEYSGIQVKPISARNTTITGCSVSYCGYNGYFIEGSFTATNLAGSFCLNNLDDGGIFYTGVGHTPSVIPASALSNSIFHDAVGAPLGTSNGSNQAVVVYLDDNSNHVTVSGITGFNAGQYIFFSHNNQNITWSNCLGKDAGVSVWAGVHDNLGAKLSSIILSGNQFINTTGQLNILKSITTDSAPADISNWGTAASNYYANTISVTSPYQTQIYTPTPVSAVQRTFTSWKSATAQDGTSSYSNVTAALLFLYNATATPTISTLVDNYVELNGTVHNAGPLTIPAYSSYFLIFSSHPTPPPPSPTYYRVRKRQKKY